MKIVRAWLCDVANEIIVSTNTSQVELKSLGLELDTNTAGHSLLAVNICGTIMSSFAIG